MSKKMKIEVFRETGELKDWRWRLIAANGKIIATSGEGYKRKASCVAIAEKISGEIDLVIAEAAK